MLKRFPLPAVDVASGKDSRGRVAVIGGSARVPGAVLLSGEAALRAGAGKVQIAAPKTIGVACGVAFPECGVLALDVSPAGEPRPAPFKALAECIDKADAVLIGPGLMDESAADALLRKCLTAPGHGVFVVDAMALARVWTHAKQIKASGKKLVLTPHHGEMATMLGVSRESIDDNPGDAATRVAARLGCHVILKNETTCITAPSGTSWQFRGGVPGLATSGSGDVLAGLLAGLLARGAETTTAALWAVWLHGAAGVALSKRIGSIGFLARELLDEIPTLLRRR